jgi:hypothetical protein
LPNINVTDSDGTVTSVPSMEDITCTPPVALNISNSNDSYDVNTLVNLELPNINFTDSDGITTNVPSMENITATPSTPPTSIRVSNSDDSYDVTTLVDLELPNSTVSNSDDSYVQLLPATESLELPLENLTVEDANGVVSQTLTNSPYKDITINVLANLPSGIVYQRNYQSRQLVSHAIYDDAWQLNNGSYNYTAVPNPLYIQEIDYAADSTGWTLKYNNAFGNLNRYTDINGNAPVENFATNYSIDNYTGLGHVWSAHGSIKKPWNTFYGVSGTLEGFNTSSFKGFNDWFGLNAKMASNLNKYDPIRQDVPYIRTSQRSMFTSTSYTSTTAFYWHPTLSIYYGGGKTVSLTHVLTRIHFK